MHILMKSVCKRLFLILNSNNVYLCDILRSKVMDTVCIFLKRIMLSLFYHRLYEIYMKLLFHICVICDSTSKITFYKINKKK